MTVYVVLFISEVVQTRIQHHVVLIEHTLGIVTRPKSLFASSIVEKIKKKENNSFDTTRLFLYPLKTSKNQRFFDAFRGIERDQCHEMV